MARIEDTALDKAKQEDGVWKKYAHGIEVKIASFKQAAIVEFWQELLEPFGGKEPTKEQKEEHMCRVLARFCVKDWRNVDGDDGQPLECTEETAYEKLRKIGRFRSFVYLEADYDESFEVGAAVKNS